MPCQRWGLEEDSDDESRLSALDAVIVLIMNGSRMALCCGSVITHKDRSCSRSIGDDSILLSGRVTGYD